MMTPRVWVRRSLSDRATPEGRYPSSRTAARTRSRVSARACTDPDRTRLTVAVETPARWATSPIVAAISPVVRSVVAESLRRRARFVGKDIRDWFLGRGRHRFDVGGRLLDRRRVGAHERVELVG